MKHKYGEQDPAAEALEQTTPPPADGVTLTDPPADPPEVDASLPGEKPREGREAVIPPGTPYSDVVQEIIDALQADGTASAVNCTYHLGCAKELLKFHETEPPTDVEIEETARRKKQREREAEETERRNKEREREAAAPKTPVPEAELKS